MHKRLLIIGAGGHGRVLADIAVSMRQWEVIAFLDDNKDCLDEFFELKIIGKAAGLCDYVHDSDFVVGIGDNSIRSQFHERLELAGASIATLIHPYTYIGAGVTIGEGSVIMPGVVINCCSKIGKGCVINTSASIDHDNVLEDFVHISPGVSVAGNVRIGKYSWLGIGCNVSNGLSITNDCIIGAGALVINDIKEEGTYIGVPIRKI